MREGVNAKIRVSIVISSSYKVAWWYLQVSSDRGSKMPISSILLYEIPTFLMKSVRASSYQTAYTE